ncbi:MAG: 30S ribosomal protein S18 [Dehalococcoidia bacterium]|nr:MAG: 30S ribosomal protein S18 [Dehalococcoidia bacterium]
MATKSKGRMDSRWSGGRYTLKRKVCSFCVNKIKEIEYKNISLLSGYISERGKINSRRRTGTCAKHQRALAMAVKRARHIALLPYAPEHIHRMGNVALLGTPTSIENPLAEEKNQISNSKADEKK